MCLSLRESKGRRDQRVFTASEFEQLGKGKTQNEPIKMSGERGIEQNIVRNNVKELRNQAIKCDFQSHLVIRKESVRLS